MLCLIIAFRLVFLPIGKQLILYDIIKYEPAANILVATLSLAR